MPSVLSGRGQNGIVTNLVDRPAPEYLHGSTVPRLTKRRATWAIQLANLFDTRSIVPVTYYRPSSRVASLTVVYHCLDAVSLSPILCIDASCPAILQLIPVFFSLFHHCRSKRPPFIFPMMASSALSSLNISTSSTSFATRRGQCKSAPTGSCHRESKALYIFLSPWPSPSSVRSPFLCWLSALSFSSKFWICFILIFSHLVITSSNAEQVIVKLCGTTCARHLTTRFFAQ